MGGVKIEQRAAGSNLGGFSTLTLDTLGIFVLHSKYIRSTF